MILNNIGYIMNKFEVTIRSVPKNDPNFIGQLRHYAKQPVSKIKELISNGLPIYSTDLSYDEFYRDDTIVGNATQGLIFLLQKENIDVIIEYGNKKYSLEEFVKFRDKNIIRKLMQRIRFKINNAKERISRINLRIRIGTFNGIPLYFHFFPVVFRRSKDGKRFYIPAFYKDDFYGYNSSISITFSFLSLSKYFKNVILWHEYGHHILNIELIDVDGKIDKKLYNIFEALASFYACCKCKLHFNSWREMYIYNFKNIIFNKIKYKINKDHQCNYFENRYNNIEENDMEIDDYVYQFYRDNGKLFLCYKEYFSKYGYNKKYNWNNLLNEIGWSHNKERWEYINYNKQN
jgi:hypothetical protein